MRFAFVHAEKACFPVAKLCRVVGVTRQGYYAYIKRRPREAGLSETRLRDRLRSLHAESRGTYGSPRLLAAFERKAPTWVNAASNVRCGAWGWLHERAADFVSPPKRTLLMKSSRTRWPGVSRRPSPTSVG